MLERDLEESPFADLGDVDLEGQTLGAALEEIGKTTAKTIVQNAPPLCLGGEHTITLPIVQTLRSFFRELVVVHLDAHSDLRDQYEGSFVNHATVIRRVDELLGQGSLIQLGIRSGTREEFHWMRSAGTILQWGPQWEKVLVERIRSRPVYLTLDLDVLDPSCLPGTGNPEPGGWSYHQMERFLRTLDRVNLVAADIVELNPTLDPSGVSSVTAARIVRELLLILGNNRTRRVTQSE